MTSRCALLVVALLAALPASAQTMASGSMPARAGYGRALAVGTDEVLVGEPRNQVRSGTVYLYGRNGDGWAQRALLQAADGHAGDGFGASLWIDGDVLLVGADRANGNTGAAYVFTKQGDAWRESARLIAADALPGAAFGSKVLLAGDVAFISAEDADGSMGAVYVFRRSGGSWSQAERITAPSRMENAMFGSALAFDGTTLFVGEFGRDDNRGAVHVLNAGANGFAYAGALAIENVAENDRVGSALAVHDGALLVGAPYANGQAGVVHRFARGSNGVWESAGRFTAFDASGQTRFGSAIAIAGERAFVGAPRVRGGRGAVYYLHGHGTDEPWDGMRKFMRAGAESNEQFGGEVAARGDVLAVGLTGDDSGAGSVAIYDYVNGAWRATVLLESPDDRLASIVGDEIRCGDNGRAAVFSCQDVELVSFMSVPDIGGERGILTNDVWGWTDAQTGKEYAIVGRTDGTAFVDISDPENPRYLGSLAKPAESPASTWRDMKVYSNHVYIVADGAGPHGMQVFDLTRLRDVTGEPQAFTTDAHYRDINSAHNIVINEATGFGYIVGASSGGETCGGALHMVDLRTPKRPTFAGCFADTQTGRASTGYSHDAMCINYNGPDVEHRGRELCFGSNETALSIGDVTDKSNPRAISRATYPNVGYSHQGWITEDHRFFYMNDELDELAGSTPRTRTMIWDVTDIDDPQLVGEFMGATEASDHNLYIRGNTMYQSNYQAGLRVIDISNPTEPKEIGYFDTVPTGENVAGFGGSWSNYPFFASNIIIVTSGNEGLFLLKKRDTQPIS